MKPPRPRTPRTRRTTKKKPAAERSHRVKIAGQLTIEELSQALQMALARMDAKGHDHVGQVSLYYRPVRPKYEHQDPNTIEITLPDNPPDRV